MNGTLINHHMSSKLIISCDSVSIKITWIITRNTLYKHSKNGLTFLRVQLSQGTHNISHFFLKTECRREDDKSLALFLLRNICRRWPFWFTQHMCTEGTCNYECVTIFCTQRIICKSPGLQHKCTT